MKLSHLAFVSILSLTSVFPVLAASSDHPLNPVVDAEDNRQASAPALLQAVNSTHARIRARAAQAFGRIRDSAGLPSLYTLAQDPDAHVRSESAFALGQFGWSASFANGHESAIVQVLLPLLTDKSVSVRAKAVEALGKVGLDKTPDLVSAGLSDSSALIRSNTLRALGTYRSVILGRTPSATVAPLSDDVVNAMLKLAHDPSASVRRNLANYFSSVSDARGLSAMMDLLAHDCSFQVRYFAINALAKIKDASAVPGVLTMLQDHHYVMRVAALQALAALKATDQLPLETTRALASDSIFHVRSVLAQSLAQGKLATDLTTLNKLLSDVSPSVRGDALRSIAVRLTDGAEDDIQAALADPSYVERVAAVDAAQSLTTDMEAVLQKADLDTNVLVRDEALGALSTVATATAFATISNSLSSTALSERNSGIYALEGRAEPSIPSLFFSTYLNSLNDPKWNGLREEVASDLAAVNDDETTGYLKTLTADSDYLVASQAEAALTARGVTGLPPLPAQTLTYSPYRTLRFDHDPILVFETTKGLIEIRCHARDAQITTASIAGFAESGGYDGLPWHRVVSDFIIQGGDPDKTGYGDAGWELRSEINSWKFTRGAVGIARSSDFDSGSVQIFINTVATPFLDGQYTVFAEVVKGMDVVDHIEMGDLILKASILKN